MHFTTDLNTDNLLFAYVNNIVVFKSDSLLDVAYATITIDSSVKTIFPHPSGEFYFNFKEWIGSLANKNNFADTLQTDIVNDGYIYQWNDSVLNTSIEFKITFSNSTYETTTRSIKWLNAVIQLQDYKARFPINTNINDTVILSPFALESNIKTFAKYWQGYPFDLTIYNGTDETMFVKNHSNLVSNTFNTPAEVSRFVLSDGDTDTTIESILPLQDGFNSLQFDTYFIDVLKVPYCLGTYLKWINSLGGYSYWLFSNANVNRTPKDIGEINNDFNNVGDTVSPTIQMGKESSDSLNVTSDTLTDYENNLLIDILESPKVYLFTGQPFAKNDANSWLEVSIKSTTTRIKNARKSVNKIDLTIDLPQRNTMKL